jgi:hypothetical protein
VGGAAAQSVSESKQLDFEQLDTEEEQSDDEREESEAERPKESRKKPQEVDKRREDPRAFFGRGADLTVQGTAGAGQL